MRSNFSGDAAADLRRDVETLKDDLNILKADLVSAMRDVVEAGKSQGAEARAKIEDAINEKLERLNAAAGEVASRGRHAAESASRYVEQKPLQSLALAFGVGLLLGAVLRQ